MKIKLTDKERQILTTQVSAIRAGELAQANLSALSTIIIERAGMDSNKKWMLDPSVEFLEEVDDGMAPE